MPRKPKKPVAAPAKPPAEAAPKRANRTGKPIQIWIPAELREELDGIVEATKPATTLTAVVALALEEFVERRRSAD